MDEAMTDDGLARVLGLMRLVGADLQRYEVKSSRKGLTKDIARTLSAFSNGSGGLVICGISEMDGFVPVKGFDARKVQESLARVCNEDLVPPVRPEIRAMTFEGAPVIVAAVSEMRPVDKPCYIKASGRYSGSYIRTGDGDMRLSSYEVDRLVDEHRQPRHDAAIVEDATLDDLDTVLVQGLLARERRVHARNFAKVSDVEALIKLGVVKKDAEDVVHPTIAGLVALGEYPQQFYPRLNVAFACYPGVRKSDVTESGQRLLDSATMTGPVSYMVEDSIAAVTRNTRTGALVEGTFRREVPDYPPIALREAIVNALMHRDYSSQALGTPVQLDLYADRLEISNPGGLYGNVTLRLLGRDGVSASRNQFLSSLLESVPYPDGGFVAENGGMGYQTIEVELSGALMPPPEPHDSIASFSVTFLRRRLTQGEQTLPAAMQIPETILGMLREQDSVSTTEVVRSTGRSRGTVMRYINKMRDEGTLELTKPVGSTRQRYRIGSR